MPEPTVSYFKESGLLSYRTRFLNDENDLTEVKIGPTDLFNTEKFSCTYILTYLLFSMKTDSGIPARFQNPDKCLIILGVN